MSKEIIHDRRYFLGIAATIIFVAQLEMVHSAEVQSGREIVPSALTSGGHTRRPPPIRDVGGEDRRALPRIQCCSNQPVRAGMLWSYL